MKDAMKAILSNMDRGFYKQAATGVDDAGNRYKLSGYGYLSKLFEQKGLVPSAEEMNERIKRLMFKCNYVGKAAENISDTALQSIRTYAWESWALEKALEDAGIRVKGATADRFEKFFATTASTILFPAYVESQIMMGMLAAPLLGELIATETNIDSHTYQALWFTDVVADQQLNVVGEGAVLPTTQITTAERSITLTKYGRMLEASYEALRLQRLNVVSVMLQRIGYRIALDETDDAITCLISGDGNTGSGFTNATDIDADVQGTLDYDELVKLYLGFAEGYNFTTAVTRDANIRTILNMAEFKDPTAGFTFQRNGVLPGPMGASWHRWNSTGTTALTAMGILGIDNSIALEQVTEQGVMTESDKLIDRQIERTAITKWTGFSNIDYSAKQYLDVNAEL
jgi:hypothetical protein